MEVTKELLSDLFDQYNRLYFDGRLKRAKMGFISKNFKTIVGQFEFEIDKNRHLKNKSIKINKGIDWDEEKLRRVLLHEMIHLSVTQKYRRSMKHGFAFIKECKRIESQNHVKVLHCWMRKGYINKRDSFFTLLFILCRNMASLVKFRIIQKII